MDKPKYFTIGNDHFKVERGWNEKLEGYAVTWLNCPDEYHPGGYSFGTYTLEGGHPVELTDEQIKEDIAHWISIVYEDERNGTL